MSEKRIGIISDTHGLLRDEVRQALTGCDLIIHAGDIGSLEVLEQLQKISRVIAIRGNVDIANDMKDIDVTKTFEYEGLKFFLIHNINKLEINPYDENIDIIVYGHSHKQNLKKEDGVIYINPGSVGPRRFNLPISFAMIKKSDSKVELEFIET